MPTYVYECKAGMEFEVEQSIKAPKLETCPLCEKCTPKRLIDAKGSFILLGGGWAESGYSSDPK